MSATDVRSILDAAANQILAVVAPLTARLVRAYVTLIDGRYGCDRRHPDLGAAPLRRGGRGPGHAGRDRPAGARAGPLLAAAEGAGGG